jgi:hypothetical protein
MGPRAWLLNFEAEAELEDPSARTPSRAVLARSRALVSRVLALLGPGDVVLDEGTRAAGFEGRAWCPTPGALAAIARAGARAPTAPPVEVLRAVNHRRFCAGLGQTLEGARYVTTEAELREALASGGGPWVLKRPFGFAGRGRLRIGARGIDAAGARWIEASLAPGEGLQVEPWVERAGDFAIHGHLSAAGELVLGEPTSQVTDERGVWISTARTAEGEMDPGERDALLAAARETAEALHVAGYFGPFGVDAFRYRDAAGGIRWNPRCEVNARYSMGWQIGMSTRRPDLDPWSGVRCHERFGTP